MSKDIQADAIYVLERLTAAEPDLVKQLLMTRVEVKSSTAALGLECVVERDGKPTVSGLGILNAILGPELGVAAYVEGDAPDIATAWASIPAELRPVAD